MAPCGEFSQEFRLLLLASNKAHRGVNCPRARDVGVEPDRALWGTGVLLIADLCALRTEHRAVGAMPLLWTEATQYQAEVLTQAAALSSTFSGTG